MHHVNNIMKSFKPPSLTPITKIKTKKETMVSGMVRKLKFENPLELLATHIPTFKKNPITIHQNMTINNNSKNKGFDLLSTHSHANYRSKRLTTTQPATSNPLANDEWNFTPPLLSPVQTEPKQHWFQTQKSNSPATRMSLSSTADNFNEGEEESLLQRNLNPLIANFNK